MMLECAIEMKSLNLKKAVWIYWDNFLKIHHLTFDSTDTLCNVCVTVEMLVDVAHVAE